MNCKKIFAILTAMLMMLVCTPCVYSDGPAVPAQTETTDILDGIDAKSIYVCETGTGKVLYERDPEEQTPMGHMAKLMTVLIAAEELDSGKLSLDDIVVVTANANSKQGTQIWLDVGEKISVEELIKSITIGNANDACTALAEKMSGSEDAFVKRMNKRAKRLGMKNTYFADCCGMDDSTVSTAKDIAILSSELVKYDNLTSYFTTWIDNVRDKAVELVSTNRLVRTYKGIKGMKSCSSDSAGECISACAKRGDFGICAVLLGCGDRDGKFTGARDLLDGGFRNFRVFSPEIDKKYLENITVNGGEKPDIGVKLDGLTNIILPVGVQSQIESVCKLPETVDAPVKKGDVLGEINYINGDETLLTVKIVAAQDVGIMDFKCAMKKSLSNLLNIR